MRIVKTLCTLVILAMCVRCVRKDRVFFIHREKEPQKIWSNNCGSTADVLESYVDEGRGKLRKARGRSTHPVIPRLPNGVTQLESCLTHAW